LMVCGDKAAILRPIEEADDSVMTQRRIAKNKGIR